MNKVTELSLAEKFIQFGLKPSTKQGIHIAFYTKGEWFAGKVIAEDDKSYILQDGSLKCHLVYKNDIHAITLKSNSDEMIVELQRKLQGFS